MGDAFYHELAVITDGLPRSYLVKQCHDKLNKMCRIDRLEGNFEGANVHSVETVFKEHIPDFLKQNNNFDFTCDKTKIKINGDGVRITRNSNFISLSFSILQTEESVMSAKGNGTLGIINGSGSYHTIIKEAFQRFFKEINDLIAKEK